MDTKNLFVNERYISVCDVWKSISTSSESIHFRHCSFFNLDFRRFPSGNVSFEGCLFKHCIFTNLPLSNITCDTSTFDRCIFSGIILNLEGSVRVERNVFRMCYFVKHFYATPNLGLTFRSNVFEFCGFSSYKPKPETVAAKTRYSFKRSLLASGFFKSKFHNCVGIEVR